MTFSIERSDASSPVEHRTTAPAAEDGWRFSRALSCEREPVERFIEARFARAHGARLRRHFPLLMSLRHHGELVAACGLREAASGRLFLETYLDQAVEWRLSALCGEAVARAGIVEVGNLAVARPGLARELIFRLTLHLHREGVAWVAFSAVAALRNNFRRLGIPLVSLALADGNRLPAAERCDWGRYYDAAPVVTAVRVAAARAALEVTPCIR